MKTRITIQTPAHYLGCHEAVEAFAKGCQDGFFDRCRVGRAGTSLQAMAAYYDGLGQGSERAAEVFGEVSK